MKILHDVDYHNWTVGIKICRDRTNGRVAIMIELLCLAFLFFPFKRGKPSQGS